MGTYNLLHTRHWSSYFKSFGLCRGYRSLASGASDIVNGQIIYLDEGLLTTFGKHFEQKRF